MAVAKRAGAGILTRAIPDAEARLTDLTALPTLDHVRVRGGARLAFAEHHGRTHAADVFETGGYRVLMPHQRAMREAVIINTGGGMAGGDHVSFSVSAGPRAAALVTSQAAERIYRSTGPVTRTQISLDVADGATLVWAPQETILYSGAKLQRSLEITMAASSRLIVSETVVLGRRAMGETLGPGLFKDRWHVRRAGALVYADAVHLDGEIEMVMAREPVTGGRHVVATMLAVMPDAEDKLETVRAALAALAQVETGVSAWNGLLTIRMIGERLEAVRAAVAAGLVALGLSPLPRVWNT